MTQPTIRPAIAADIPAITAIYRPAVLAGTASFEVEPPGEEEMLRRFRSLTEAGYPYFVAELDGRVAGYAYAGPYRSRPGYRFTVENSIYIAPDAQGKGIGRLLLDRLVSTYAVHHLTENEKALLLKQVGRSLSPGGVAVFGDLMFEDAASAAQLAEKYADRPEVVQSFEEEHFWHVDGVYAMADAAGLSVTDVRRFSDLSWGMRIEPALGTAGPR